VRLLRTPTARSRKVTQRRLTYAESASSLPASVIITGSNFEELESQQQWLKTRMKAAAPQALLVAD
jgi:hypothetical protein